MGQRQQLDGQLGHVMRRLGLNRSDLFASVERPVLRALPATDYEFAEWRLARVDGEAVVIGPDGLSRFDELRRRDSAKSAVLFAFDLIEQNGEDLRSLPFLERKDALARLLRGIKVASCSTSTLQGKAGMEAGPAAGRALPMHDFYCVS
jgi:hypothetical protein